MTLTTFVNDMRGELALLFSEWKTRSESGGYNRFSVFEYALPVPSGEESAEPFPYIVIRAEEGGTAFPDSPEALRVTFTVGIYDDREDNRGYIDVLNAIDRIRQRFEKNPLLKKQYYKLQSEQYPTRWAIPDGDSYPYFFGALEMYFAIPKIETEDLLT